MTDNTPHDGLRSTRMMMMTSNFPFDEDELEEIISDSFDMGWKPRWAAQAIIRAYEARPHLRQRRGWLRSCGRSFPASFKPPNCMTQRGSKCPFTISRSSSPPCLLVGGGMGSNSSAHLGWGRDAPPRPLAQCMVAVCRSFIKTVAHPHRRPNRWHRILLRG